MSPVVVVPENVDLDLFGRCPFDNTGYFLQNAVQQRFVGLSGA